MSPTVAEMVRPEVRALRRYHLDLSPCVHKLDQNEVPYDMPPPLKRRAAARIAERSWAIYPDFHADSLRESLGAMHDHPAAGVLVGNGSNELLATALEAIVRPGERGTGGEVLTTVPSFGLYRTFVVRAGGVPRFLGPRDDLRLPIDELEREVERDPSRPVILCTPNNPTGDAVPPARVERLLDRLEAPLLLDNAYGEFCGHDYRPLVARHRHLLLFRTFSKAWSLGGARLGYLLADPELVEELIKVKLPYNVGFPSAFLGEAVLDSPSAARRRVRAILGRRPQWAVMLARHGFEVMPSEANFHLARVPDGVGVADLLGALEARGIRIRDVSAYPGLSRHVRVSVGSGRALRDVDRALSAILESQEVRS